MNRMIFQFSSQPEFGSLDDFKMISEVPSNCSDFVNTTFLHLKYNRLIVQSEIIENIFLLIKKKYWLFFVQIDIELKLHLLVP